MNFKILCTIKNFTASAADILKNIGEVDCLELRQEELAKVIEN